MNNYDYFIEANDYLKSGNGRQALNIFKKKLKKNPNNPCIKITYAKLLLCNEETMERGFKLATKVADSKYRNIALLTLGRYHRLNKDFNKSREYFNELIYSENFNSLAAVKDIIYLDILEGKYEDAYILLNKYYDKINNCKLNGDLENIKFYLKHKLNILRHDDLNSIDNFFCRMLVSYNENSVINYIKKNDEVYNSKFNSDIIIDDLLKQSKYTIKNLNPIFSTLTDHYIIKYDNPIGFSNNIETSNIRVVTFMNTDDILTMYPVSHDFIYSQNFGFESSQKIKKLI